MLQYGQQRTASVTPVLSGDRTLHCTPIPAAPRTVPLCTQQLSPGAPSPCYAPWLLSGTGVSCAGNLLPCLSSGPLHDSVPQSSSCTASMKKLKDENTQESTERRGNPCFNIHHMHNMSVLQPSGVIILNVLTSVCLKSQLQHYNFLFSFTFFS